MPEVQVTLRSAYLAGPMRGHEHFNFPAFHRASRWLRSKDWTVYSPAERDEADYSLPTNAELSRDGSDWSGVKGKGLDYFMQFDLAAVCREDAVVCLTGWETSRGARLEAMVAVEVEHPVFEITGPGGVRIDGWDEEDWQLTHISPEYIKAVFAVHSLGLEDECSNECSNCHCHVPEQAMQAIVHNDPGDETDYPPAFERAYEPQHEAPEAFPEGLVPQFSYQLTDAEDIAERDAGSTVRGDSAARKAVPITSGVLDYFPAALVEVARVSKAGNDKHNPGQPMHHARSKSTDHADSLLRHLIDRGKVDSETGVRHSAEMAWRALALLQQELEDEGLAPLPRGARL